MSFEDLPAPLQLPYLPQVQAPFSGQIAVVGCGEISSQHLAAYRERNFPVTALCDRNRAKAEARASEFFPQAKTYHDYRQVLALPEITIVDITTHLEDRTQLIHDAIAAGKHVLSQKPFVDDLAVGQRLIQWADQHQVLLAVNQNARWAPHFSYMRQAVKRGSLGRLAAIRFAIDWDHTWTRGTKFESMHHLLLHDFAIHWFDLIIALMPERPWESVTATLRHSADQNMRPPMLAQVIVDFADAQASLTLDAATPFLPINQTYLAGSQGSIHSTGPDYSVQHLVIENADGRFDIPLTGLWFPDGFGGAMVELINSIQERREPEHSAANNLPALALCFAAMRSAEINRAVRPGEVTTIPAKH